MKIGIITDIIDLKEKTGIPNYLKYLVHYTSKVQHNHTIYLVHYENNPDSLYQNMNEIIAPLYPVKPTRLLQTSLTDALKLPSLLKENDIDLIHAPSPTPFHNPLFLQHGFKKVLTIHDLYKFFPHLRHKLKYNLKGWAHDLLWRHTLLAIKNNVDKYIADSENTKKDILKFLKVPEDKIEVIYLAPHERFKQMKLEIPGFISSPFILSDNIRSDIIEMYYKLKKRGVEHKLIIFGGGNVNELEKTELGKIIGDLNLQNDIIFAGYVSDNDLLKLYNTADLYIRPSWYEGFGLPPLEAMACGCPVIVSNVASLPEVVGDAGILVDPYNINEWADVIYDVLINDGLRQDMIKKGLTRAKMFSWQKTAKETVKVYESVYNP